MAKTLQKFAPWCLCAIMVIIFSSIPIAFFFHHLTDDTMNYYLMSKQIAATGKPAALLAANLPPLVYASGISYVYAPIFYLFDTYPERLRAIQYLNISMIGIFFALVIRYFRAAAPLVNTSKISLLFGLAILINSGWQFAAMWQNSDILPAVLTVAASLIACDSKQPLFIKAALLLAIGVVGFFIKLSLVLIPIAFVIERLTNGQAKITKRHIWAAVFGVAAVVSLIVANHAVITIYAYAFLHHPRNPLMGVSPVTFFGNIANSAANLWFAAIPDKILPNFHILFVDGQYTTTAFTPHHVTLRLIVGLITGSAISTSIIVGARRLWKHRPFDVILFLITVPIFAIVTNSTARYLLVFQPFLWVCMIYALQPAWHHIVENNIRLRAIIIGVICILLIIEAKTLGALSQGNSYWRANSLISYINNMASAYGDAYNYLNRQNPSEVRLVYLTPQSNWLTNWNWIEGTNLPIYSPQTGFPEWANGHRVLAVISCRKPDCEYMPLARISVIKQINNNCYTLLRVREFDNASAIIEIDEVIPKQQCRRQTKS